MAWGELMSSDDEFPDLQVVAKRVRQPKLPAAQSGSATASKEDSPAKENKSASRRLIKPSVSASLTNGTPLRRRKLVDSEPLDNPLFRKWSADLTEPKARTSRVSSRETRPKTLSAYRAEHVDSDEASEQSDDDVVVRRRQPTRPATRKPQRQRADSLIKTEAVLSVTELDDEGKSVMETLEISAIISEGGEQSSDDEESEFVTALSDGLEAGSESNSDSEYQSPGGSDVSSEASRPTSPSMRTLATARLPPPQARPKRSIPATKTEREKDFKDADDDQEPDMPSTPPKRNSRPTYATAQDIENHFQKLRLYAEELDDVPEPKPSTQLEPMTPRKTLQASPRKAPKIPPSPWKAEHKEFWDVGIQNEWIDKHSPAKRGPQKLDLTAGADKKVTLKQKYGTSPEKKTAKKAFEQTREKMAHDFLHELDERVTAGQLSQLTAATGGLQIKWSSSLQTTAGRAHWKCKEVTTKTQQPDGEVKSVKERRHEGWIELAAKVLNNEDDLMNTVAHEFCHLAVFMLNGKPKFAHGAEFKSWGQKCMDAFHSRGIVVTTKHNYEIDFKFIWRCVDCTCEVKRHSKSVNPEKQRCGRCRGILEQVKPVPRANGKGRTAYQEFVSKEMKDLKAEGKALNFKEMMAIVSARWKAQQEGNKTNPGDKQLQGLEQELEGLEVTDLTSD
ncbi:hypothetical protein E8E14_011924 [Neopestalotiopsis sp. 37M]|nr:hypothetical protein E8E14_011924 [Neopestalotiopsis sp. 37M]